MNKKSFFRGFGSGIIFTSLILGISFVVRTSDPYVTSRAKELGMVYETDTDDSRRLTEKNTEETPLPVETEVPEEKKDTKDTEVPPAANKAEKSSVPTSDVKAGESTTKSSSEEAADIRKQLEQEKKEIEDDVKKDMEDQQKKLTIDAGDWSLDVSEKLEELGIVKSAQDFDQYLNDNGYGVSISAGTYDVSVEDTYEELARKITKK